MGHHKHKLQKQHQQDGEAQRKAPVVTSSRCCCNPCDAVSYLIRGVGRCLFVSCFPVLQCLQLDDYRHRHHDQHRHFH